MFLLSNTVTICFAVPAQVTGLTVASQGSTNSLFTNWTRALGDVDSYQVLLIHENVVIKNETVPSETTRYHFYPLKPGGLYSVVVTTVSGGISSRQMIAEGRTGKKEILQHVFFKFLEAEFIKENGLAVKTRDWDFRNTWVSAVYFLCVTSDTLWVEIQVTLLYGASCSAYSRTTL